MNKSINWVKIHKIEKRRRKWLSARHRSEKQAEKRKIAQQVRREKKRQAAHAHAIMERVKRKRIKKIAAKFIEWRANL